MAKRIGIKGTAPYVSFRGKTKSTSTVSGENDRAAVRHGSTTVKRRDHAPRGGDAS